MNLEKSHLTSYPKCKLWYLQIAGVLMLYISPLPTYANNDDTLLQFSIQVGSIMYVLFIAYFFARNDKVRMMLLVVYFFPVSAPASARITTAFRIAAIGFL